MSANEIANHIEAACWLRFGPSDPPGIVPPPLYFRSQNGFIDEIGVLDVTDPLGAPVCYLQLDRYYSRNEVAIYAFIPTVFDLITVPPDPPAPIVTPSAHCFEPSVFPVDSRLMYGEIPIPTDPVELNRLFETFNGFTVGLSTLTGGGEDPVEFGTVAADVCILVVRIPRGSSGPNTVRYKAFTPISP